MPDKPRHMWACDLGLRAVIEWRGLCMNIALHCQVLCDMTRTLGSKYELSI